ncbi:MAG: hypothetical protein MZU91_12105 [Desulfosudis oleivorans]|nr:hypothetical protein [Desulfosudis oleivorans]
MLSMTRKTIRKSIPRTGKAVAAGNFMQLLREDHAGLSRVLREIDAQAALLQSVPGAARPGAGRGPALPARVSALDPSPARGPAVRAGPRPRATPLPGTCNSWSASIGPDISRPSGSQASCRGPRSAS